MKTIASILFLAVVALSSCRGGGGPATRVGRGVDHAFYKAGQGISTAGHAIENTAR
jgi:predicted small secreted protein